MKSIPLFERYQALAQHVPWTPIVSGPTPIEQIPALASRLGDNRLYVKREDQTHPVIGGNKVRGLEFLLGDALQRKIDALITFGAAGSNHVAATAFHARALGMSTTALMIAQPQAPYVARNLFDDLAAEARLVPVNPITAGPRFAYEWLRLKRGNKRVRIIPPGGTSPLSCLGHVNAALELRAQIDAGLLPPPDYLFVGLGSLGTAAGLVLGCRLAGLATRIVGVVVFHRWFCTAGRCARLAHRTLRFIQARDSSVQDGPIHRADFEIVATALGRGYAHPTPEAMQLSDSIAECGPALDQSYTSKTLAGALTWIETNRMQDRNLLYWHSYQHRPALTVDQIRTLEATLPYGLRQYLTRTRKNRAGECPGAAG